SRRSFRLRSNENRPASKMSILREHFLQDCDAFFVLLHCAHGDPNPLGQVVAAQRPHDDFRASIFLKTVGPSPTLTKTKFPALGIYFNFIALNCSSRNARPASTIRLD